MSDLSINIIRSFYFPLYFIHNIGEQVKPDTFLWRNYFSFIKYTESNENHESLFETYEEAIKHHQSSSVEDKQTIWEQYFAAKLQQKQNQPSSSRNNEDELRELLERIYVDVPLTQESALRMEGFDNSDAKVAKIMEPLYIKVIYYHFQTYNHMVFDPFSFFGFVAAIQ